MRWLPIAVLLVVAGAVAWAQDAAVPGPEGVAFPRPASPAVDVTFIPSWADQWQPELDQSDTRLSARCSAWEKRIELEDLLAALSEASGVRLIPGDSLQHMRVTIFSREHSLSGTMIALADLFQGYWAYRRGEAPLERTYYLVEPRPIPPDEVDDWLEEQWQQADREINARLRPQVEAQIDLYRDLLKLSPKELLARYEKDNPWLCANLLDPAERPLLERLCTFDQQQRDTLFEKGAVTSRVAELEPALKQHLRDWFEGVDLRRPDADRSKRERAVTDDVWQNMQVGIEWRPPWLGVAFYQAGREVMNTGLLWTGNSAPGRTRGFLANMGYGSEKPEDWRREDEEWAKAHPDSREQNQYELRWAQMTPPPNDSDERLKLALDLPDPKEGWWSIKDVLSDVGERYSLPVVSHFISSETDRVWLRKDRQKPGTLGEFLRAFGYHRTYTPWTWSFRGGCLVLSNVGYRLDEAGRLPAPLREQVATRIRAGQRVSLDDVAGLFVGLNARQATTMGQVLDSAGLWWASYWSQGLVAYGSVTAEQRARLRMGGKVEIGELKLHDPKLLSRSLDPGRKLVAKPDLSRAALSGNLERVPEGRESAGGGEVTSPPRLSEGERTFLNVTVSYDLPGSPEAWVRLLTAPLESKVTNDPKVALGDE